MEFEIMSADLPRTFEFSSGKKTEFFIANVKLSLPSGFSAPEIFAFCGAASVKFLMGEQETEKLAFEVQIRDKDRVLAAKTVAKNHDLPFPEDAIFEICPKLIKIGDAITIECKNSQTVSISFDNKNFPKRKLFGFFAAHFPLIMDGEDYTFSSFDKKDNFEDTENVRRCEEILSKMENSTQYQKNILKLMRKRNTDKRMLYELFLETKPPLNLPYKIRLVY